MNDQKTYDQLYGEIEQYEETAYRDVTAVSLEDNIENAYAGIGEMPEIDVPAISRAQSKVIASMDKLEYRRVLLVNTVVGTGSVGRLVSGLYDTLLEHGYECLVAYGRGEAPEGMNAYRIGTDTDMYIHGALTRLTDRHGFYSKKATQDFIRVIEDYDPDIIHLHNVHGYYLNIKVLFHYLKNCGRKIIWTLHDCWSFTGHCSHFEYIGCQKWQTVCNSCEQINEYPKSYFKDNSKNNFIDKQKLFTGIDNLTIVTPSEWLKERVEQSFLGEYDTIVIPTGIDLEQFAPVMEERREDNIIYQLKTNLGLRGKNILLGVANPWRERKGLLQFDSLSKVIADNYVIVLLGLNDDQLSMLPPSIIGISKTDSVEELAAIYSMADIYVNLTLEDTFPTTNIEALACGTPVVTYKAGGSPESLDDTCGISVDRNSVQGVIAAIEKIITAKGELYTPQMCVRRAKLYDKKIRFMEYLQEAYEGL